MKRLLRALEVLAWVAVFLIAAVVLGLRYWLLPRIELYRDDIVQSVSRSLGRPVKVGAIEAGWLGLRPQVTLTDVKLYDAEGREALALPSVDNVVSWRSLLTGELHLHSLLIDSPRLRVRRDASGLLHVAGLAVEQKGDGRFLEWVLSQHEIVVRNAEVEWLDEKRAAPPLTLSQLNLRLRNVGAAHLIGLTARPPSELGASLDVRAELAGASADQPATWSGRVYAELGSTDLAGWRAWLEYPADVQSGQGAIRLWATLEGGRITGGTADVALAGVSARLSPELPLLELSRLSGRLQARRSGAGYEVSGRKLSLVPVRGAELPPSDLRFEWQPAAQAPEHGSLTASLVELQPLAQIGEALPLPPEVRQLLADLSPRGRLSDARIDWQGPLAAPTELGGKASFAGLAMRPSGSLPGFSGLSGSFEASRQKGSVVLTARGAQIELPEVLSEPRLALDRLDGQLNWEKAPSGELTVRTQSLAFANEDFDGKASGTYSRGSDGPGAIDLEANLRRAEGLHISRYLPKLLGQATHDWLARAIVAGHSGDVRLRLKGDLRDFPFADPAKGQFQVTARVEKGVLDYVSGWPRIEDIDADLLFEADRMEIYARSASVLGARVSAVHVRIPSFLTPPVRLQVLGQASGPTREFLRYIEASPVARMTGGATEGMRASGNGKLQLKLELPLRELSASKVEGDFEFASNDVVVPHGNLPPIERARGKVSFTEAGFTLHDVKGRVFGGPVTLSGGTRRAGGVEIVAKGDATVAALQPLLDHPWRRYLSGASSYTATVLVHDRRVDVTVRSGLRGISSELPPPLDKRAGDLLPLRVEVHPADARGEERIAARLGRLAALEIRRQRSGDVVKEQRVAVALSPGIGELRRPEKPGVLIYGSLESFDVDRWRAFLADDAALSRAAKPDAVASAAAAWGSGPIALDVKARSLQVYGKRLHDVAAQAELASSGWSAQVQSQEITGHLAYKSASGGALTARLTRLYVPQDIASAKPGEAAHGTREFPAIDLVAERFAFKGKELGKLELVAQPAQADWRIERLVLASAEGAITGKGVWHAEAPARTTMHFDLDSGDAGGFLGRLGYPNMVKGGKARMQADITWAGDPTAIDYPSLSGDIQLQAQDGQFLEVNPGLGKLVSLMSLQALPRRLSLDFRDVFSKGFQFDEIAAAGRVERGLMTLKDFHMQGSAAEVEMTGEVDLAKETQNLSVRVLPSLGDSASTVLAFVNPLLVFPAAIAQKILKDPLGHIFAFNYSITGSWSDPKVAKRGIEAQEIDPSIPRPPNN